MMLLLERLEQVDQLSLLYVMGVGNLHSDLPLVLREHLALAFQKLLFGKTEQKRPSLSRAGSL